jgi:uncharacterized protein YjeT (DUF2065 family)
MPEVHLPQLDEHEEEDVPASPTAAHRPRGKSLLTIALEVMLIATGVFLGLAGEQWRESARHREMADASLRRFRSEILTNRQTVAGVKDYHVTMKKRLDAYFAADAKARPKVEVNLSGVQPASFEHTAWDLALATQSLAYIDPRLAFALSRVYTSQQDYAELSRGVLQAMYVLNPTENETAFFGAVVVYYGDVVLYEPKLLSLYDELLPQIDRALGE